MTDTQLNLQTITVNGLGVTAEEPTIPVPTEVGHATRWQGAVVDYFGGVTATFPIVGNPRCEWGLDVPERVTFKVSFDVDVTSLGLPNPSVTPPQEVQLYRNGHLMLFGPLVARRGNTKDRVWEYTAYDPLWYLQHRYFGEAARHNYLTNGSFDTDLTGWTAVGGVTQSQSVTQHLLGTGSMKLVEAVAGGQTYSRARFSMSAGALGLAVYLTAWVFVETFTDGAFGDRGAYIERQSTPGNVVTDLNAWAQQPLSEDNSPVGKWSRLSTVVEMPPNTTETIEVRLYAPQGTVYWDAVTVTISESVSLVNGNSPGGAGWDQITIAQQLVRYLSGAWPVGNPYTKSNLRLGIAGAVSGVKKERTYQFFDHQNGLDALTEFTRSSDGFDFRVDMTPTARTFRTYYPSIGITWDDSRPFRYQRTVDDDEHLGRSRTWGIVAVDWAETIEGSASDVTEMGGWGTGSGREEAAFSDPAAFGGLTLEYVEAAPTEASIDLLSAIAASRGAQLSKPITTPVLTMIEPRDPATDEIVVQLIGVLMPGDLIPVVIADGSLQLGEADDSVYVRVSLVTLNEDETLTVAIAP